MTSNKIIKCSTDSRNSVLPEKSTLSISCKVIHSHLFDHLYVFGPIILCDWSFKQSRRRVQPWIVMLLGLVSPFSLSPLLLFLQLLHLHLLLGLGHDAEEGQLLLQTAVFSNNPYLFGLQPHPWSAHGLIRWKGLIEAVVLSFPIAIGCNWRNPFVQ